MRTRLRRLAVLPACALGLVMVVGAYFTARALARERPVVTPGTVHASLSRQSCVECHAPIAAEWRESFHARTVTGPFWDRLRATGYADVFRMLRVPCMNCHAPANVLDLVQGPPVERSDDAGSGIDCVSCHVSRAGITGPGHVVAAPHEVIRDERFRDPAATSVTICARCHDEDCEKTVTAWRPTRFAREGVTCLHCHMPDVDAPSVANGPVRRRRSHRFAADKDDSMLRSALNAAIVFDGNRAAAVRIINNRVGHAFPGSGMNELIVKVTARGQGGTTAGAERAFGTREWIPGYLDFWPFRRVTTIPPGEHRQVVVRLPSDHGEVSAEFRYRDWWALTGQDKLIRTLVARY